MIKREFCSAEGAKAVGFSHGDFGFVVKPFDNPAGELLARAEIVEQQLAMGTHGAGKLLHRLNSRAHGLRAPLIEELAGPDGRVVIPEALERFLQQVRPDTREVVAHQVTQFKALPVGQVLRAFEQAPARMLEQRLVALLRHAARLGGSHIIEREVHLGDDVEAVPDIERGGAVLLDELQVGLPHIRADELDLLTEFFADESKNLREALLGALLADPQQPLATGFDLIDERQILMAAAILELVHADSTDLIEATVLQAPLHDILDGVEDLLPG